MSFADLFLGASLSLALGLLGFSMVLVVLRILKGPTLPDRVLGLDTLTGLAVGFLAVFGIAAGLTLTVDIAIALGLVGFLATVAFARFIQARGRIVEGTDEEARAR